MNFWGCVTAAVCCAAALTWYRLCLAAGPGQLCETHTWKSSVCVLFWCLAFKEEITVSLLRSRIFFWSSVKMEKKRNTHPFPLSEKRSLCMCHSSIPVELRLCWAGWEAGLVLPGHWGWPSSAPCKLCSIPPVTPSLHVGTWDSQVYVSWTVVWRSPEQFTESTSALVVFLWCRLLCSEAAGSSCPLLWFFSCGSCCAEGYCGENMALGMKHQSGTGKKNCSEL